jgi:hypothetical protein
MHIKYPKIKILGDRSNEGILTTSGTVVITEKIDGANFSFYIKENILYFCSHNKNLTDSEQIEKTGLPKNWKGIEPILESWNRNPSMFNEGLYYYGESTQKHTISYDDIPGFIGYDILDIDTGLFLYWSWAKARFENMGLPFINIIAEIEVNDNITLDYLKQFYAHSSYRNGSAEGIVIKRYDTQLFAKIVDNEFKEKSKLKKPKLEKNNINEDQITEIYATPARIEKMIHKLHDDGYEIEMEMMPILYKKVIEDFLEEEILEIYQNYSGINFKVINNLVSKECRIILKEIIMN